MPREALWVALRKLGVPDQLIDIIRSFHQDMKAQIRLDDTLLEEIEVGLLHGTCTVQFVLMCSGGKMDSETREHR